VRPYDDHHHSQPPTRLPIPAEAGSPGYEMAGLPLEKPRDRRVVRSENKKKEPRKSRLFVCACET
jgi:hypothetical protein